MRARTAALIGALVGAAIGFVLLTTTHPTSAYTNDAYREGASVGFVLRYATLGLVAALLIRALQPGRRTVLPALGLVVVAAAATLPVALDDKTASERRRSAATAIEDPAAREAADFRAGAIDGCVESTRKQLAGTPDEGAIDLDRYCTCFIDELFEGRDPRQALEEARRTGRPAPEMTRASDRCALRSTTG